MTRKKKKRTQPINIEDLDVPVELEPGTIELLPPGDKIVTEEQADLATKMVLGALIPELERIADQGLNAQAALLAFVAGLKQRVSEGQ